MNQNNQSEYMTVAELRHFLNISQSAAYQLTHRKDFPVCRFGGSVRVPRTALLRWLEQKTYIPETLRYTSVSA